MLHNLNYNSYFDQQAISNCDVLIYKNDTTPTLLLSKDNIVKMSMRRTNNGVLDNIPNDQTTIEVVGWNNLSSSIKSYLVSGAYIKIGFKVENAETTDCFVQVVDKVTISYDGIEAVITCVSPYMKDNTYSNSGLLLHINGLYKTFPFKVSGAEMSQHGAICAGYGQRMKVTNRTSTVPSIKTEAVNLEKVAPDLYLNSKNIYNVRHYKDENDRSTITAYGVQQESEWVLLAEKEANNYFAVVPFETQVVVRRVECQAYDGSNWVDKTCSIPNDGLFSNEVEILCDDIVTYYQKYRYKVYGYFANIVVPNNIDKSLKCYALIEHVDILELQNAQAKARYYYSHLDYYEFDCRLDPRIEPQDNIYVDGIGIMRVEEVELTFNGGFKGHIKGRYLTSGDIDEPVLENVWYYEDERQYFEFGIEITNPNDVAVDFYMIGSAGENIYIGTLQAGQTRTFDQTDRDFQENFENHFYQKYNGFLEDDVWGWFETDYNESDSILILEADY